MKRNMIIGIIACAVAVSSAFTTVAPETAYVLAKTSASQPSFTCQATSVQCNNAAPFACQVTVNTTINGGTKTVNGRRATSCTLLSGESAVPAQAPETFYDIQ